MMTRDEVIERLEEVWEAHKNAYSASAQKDAELEAELSEILTWIKTPDTLALTFKKAVQASSISRSQLYIEIAEGRLRAIKCRGRTLIIESDLRQFLEKLPTVPSNEDKKCSA